MPSKSVIRREMLTKRRNLSPAVREEAVKLIVERLAEIDILQQASSIMGYLALPHELNIDSYLKMSIERGKIIGVPVTDVIDRRIYALRLFALDRDITYGIMGIREPIESRSIRIPNESFDAIIVPGVAFDKRGNRLGYGGGYYDRFIGELTRDILLVGVAFDEQLVDELPVEEYDKQVHLVVTPSGIITGF